MNYNFFKVGKLILIFSLGCISSCQMIEYTPKNFEFSQNSEFGIVAFTAQCIAPNAMNALFQYSGSKPIINLAMTGSIFIPCDGKKHIKVLTLLEDKYGTGPMEVNAYSGPYLMNGEHSIDFTVKRHQVNYIGSLTVDMVGKEIIEQIDDNYATDKYLIQQQIPRIPLSLYKNKTTETVIEDK